MREIKAIAIADDEEHEFYFEIADEATDMQVLDKAFEIAYCKYMALDEVTVIS